MYTKANQLAGVWPGGFWKHAWPPLICILQISDLGTNEERTVLEKAEGFGCHRQKSRPPEADVDLVLPTLEVAIGDDFELSLGFNNRSDQRRVVEAYISGNVVYYTGVSSAEFLLREPKVAMEPNESGRSLSSLFSNKIRIPCPTLLSSWPVCRCERVGPGWVEEVHEAPGGTSQPSFHRHWKGQGDRANRHGHESGHSAQSQTQRQGLLPSASSAAFVISWLRPFMLFTSAVTSGVRCEQSEWGDDGDRGVHQPLLLRPGRGLHSHGRSWRLDAQIQILQVSSISIFTSHPFYNFAEPNRVLAGFSLIPKSSSLTWTEFFVPKRAGPTRVFATLDCPALRQVQGEASLTIEPWGTAADYRLVHASIRLVYASISDCRHTFPAFGCFLLLLELDFALKELLVVVKPELFDWAIWVISYFSA